MKLKVDVREHLKRTDDIHAVADLEILSRQVSKQFKDAAVISFPILIFENRLDVFWCIQARFGEFLAYLIDTQSRQHLSLGQR